MGAQQTAHSAVSQVRVVCVVRGSILL